MRIRCITVSFIVLIAALINGCSIVPPPGERPQVLDALSDFVFVGEGLYDRTSTPPHGLEARTLPTRLEAGHQYIFHRRRTVESEAIEVFYILQRRCLDKRIKVLAANNEGIGFTGGLSFPILFQDSMYRGGITNAVDNQILQSSLQVRNWLVDDYIVIIEKVN